jgi:tetratricopeptide (TPR) repeat protein
VSANVAQGQSDYTKNAGKTVDLFTNDELNYRMDLRDIPYTYINFKGQVPEASFAAMRFNPGVVSLVIVEEPGVAFTAEQYAELVRSAMTARLNVKEDVELHDYRDIGARTVDDSPAHQIALYGTAKSEPIIYVVTTLVDRSRAYQVLTFGTNQPESVVLEQADTFVNGFSIIDRTSQPSAETRTRPVDDYRSQTFGYRFRTRGTDWFSWTDLEESYDGADLGALSADGYGSVVLPVCWNGPRPHENAIYSVMMQQFGEPYPTDFIESEEPVSKRGATGRLFRGNEDHDSVNYDYYIWVVSKERCAYALGAWAPSADRKGPKVMRQLWDDFDIDDSPAALGNHYADLNERRSNAELLNVLGMHYFEAKSYRDAFGYFSHANELVNTDGAYVTNALRSLVEIDAYREAVDWLSPRLGPFAEDQTVQSWDAWLAYQTGDADKAMRGFGDLFAGGYRDDDDFSTYMTLLAEAGEWDELDRQYSAYTAGGSNQKTTLLKSQLLARRGQFVEALAVLDQMSEGRPFNADLTYERISIVYEMDDPAELLRLSDLLIDNGYRSLQSYYYKGSAEFQLRWYQKARESFEKALSYSPTSSNVKDYLAAIDSMLGEGDTAMISKPIEAVALPKDLQKIFEDSGTDKPTEGFGAVYASKIAGYGFDKSNVLHETQYRKIRILDGNGIKQFSTIEFDFDPAFEQLFVNSVIVRNNDGEQIAEASPNTFYVTHNEDGYKASTEKTVHIPVPSLAPGVVIEAVVSKSVSVESGTFPLEVAYLSSERPIEYGAVFITGDDRVLKYESSGVGKPRKTGGSIVWELAHPEPYRWEPLQPYFDQILPWVYFGTVSENWNRAGLDYLDEIRDKLEVSPVAERAKRLVEGIDDTQKRIEILSSYVQGEIHYEAIEFGQRAYMPKTARETVRDRYGDCKDHAVLLYAMLESVGIPASLALVNLQQQVLVELPNVDQFDHMIVAVDHDGVLQFIDTTDKDLRLGRLAPRSMAGNFALVLDDQPAILKIPDYDATLVGLSIERDIEAVDGQNITVTELGRFSGYQAAELRGQLREIETAEMHASLQRWLTSRYSDAELTEYFVENVFDANFDLTVELRYTLPLDDDGEFEIPGFMESYYLEFDRVSDRRYPFEQTFPLHVSSITSVKVPSGRRLNIAKKKPDSGESRFGNWNRQLSQGADTWEIRVDYVGDDTRFDAGEYRDFADFHRKLVDAIEQPLILSE